MTTKGRLSTSVHPKIISAVQARVDAGSAPNISAYVTDALLLKLDQDRRMEAFDELLSTYEAKHGVITDREMADASRWARANAVVVRGRKPGKTG